MSTYTDTKNRIKETVNVTYHPGYPDDRVSIQKVKFLNEENEYWGTFKGRSVLEDSTISGSTIYDTIIKDVTLSGRVLIPGGIDINAVGQELENVKQDIENIQTKNRQQDTATEQLDKKVDDLSADLTKQLSIANNGIEVVKEYVDEQISAVNDKINTDISTVNDTISTVIDSISDLNVSLTDKIVQTKTELSNALTTEKTERIADFAFLSTYAKQLSNNVELSTSELINKIDRDRHYEILTIDKYSYPYKVKDFAVNKLQLNIPQGKVIYKEKTIGSITRNEDGTINLTVYTLSDPYLNEALAEGYYILGAEAVPCNPGYLLRYDSINNKIEIFSTVKKHLDVVDTNTKKPNYVGKVTTFNPDSDTTVADIESGNLTIYPTSSSNYNEFQCQDKAFNKTDLSCITINNDQIIYTGNNRLVFRKNVSNTTYCKIIKEITSGLDNNIEIGRIYIGNVVSGENNEIISLKATIDNFNYEISKPNLYGSVDTLFGEQLKDHGKLAVYSKQANNIQIYDNIQYSYELKAADDTCVFKPGKTNVHLYNYNEYDTISAEIYFGNIPDKHLDFVLTSEDKNIWTSNTQYADLSIELTATFDATANKLQTIITKVGDHGTETINSTYIFDINNNTPKAVEKLYSHEIEVTSNPISFIYDNIIDIAEATFEATINQQVIIPNNVKTFQLEIKDDNINTIDIEIPAKDENLKFGNKNRAREFIFTTDLTPTNLNRYIEVKTNYAITNGVENTLSIHLDGLVHSYKFVEIEENKFLYVDLNNHDLSVRIENLEHGLHNEIINREKFDNEISTKLETLSTEVSNISSYTLDTIHELSDNVYEEIYQLSDNLSTEIIQLSSSLSGEIKQLSSSLSVEIEQLSSSLSSEIIQLSSSLSGEIIQLSTDLSGEIIQLSTNLSNEIIQLSSDLSGEIIQLSTDLSTTVSSEIFDISSYLYDEISANWLNIQILSSDLQTVSADLHNNISVTEDLYAHYNSTLSGIDNQKDISGDIKSDNLIITDPVVKLDGHVPYHDKYYLTFLSGTLVLKKIEK